MTVYQWTTTAMLNVAMLYISACAAKTLYADSSTSEHNAPCTLKEPCESLEHAVNHSAPGDMILMAATPSSHITPFLVSELKIKWSLTFRAQQVYPPCITCPLTLDTCQIKVSNEDAAGEVTAVYFDNVHINGCNICLRNASGRFDDTQISMASLDISVGIQNDVDFMSSILNDTQVRFKAFGQNNNNHRTLHLRMNDTLMSGFHSSFTLTNIGNVSISLVNVQFRDFISQMRITVKDNLHLEVHNMSLLSFTSNTAGLIILCQKGNLVGTIMNSSFSYGNYLLGGALSITSGNTSTVNLSIVGTQFQNNTSKTAGSAINLDFTENTRNNPVNVIRENVRIDSCKFIHNKNGESAAAVYIGGGNVTFTDTTFIRNAVTTELSTHMQSAEQKGAGGAIYGMRNSVIQIDNCIFINNSANWFGGAIAGNGDIQIINSYFETSNTPQSTLGELLYLSGDIRVGNLTMKITRATKNLPFIWYSSNHDSSTLQGVGDGYLDFHCPSGSQFRNDTLPELDAIGSYNDLFYFCDPCPDNTYSLLHGYRSGSLDGTGNWSSNFRCLPCTYGAVCKSGFIKSQYNFWGLANACEPPEVSMMMCPKGYCCRKPECDTYNTCAANRTGTLCGQCKPGLSETLYTTDCIDNHKCTDSWVFAVDIATSIVTLLFFLYQLEIVGFICRHLFWADVSENDDPTIAGYLKSIFYFYQTIDLLGLQENQASKIVGVAIQPFISYLLTFRSIAIIFGACPFPGTSPVTKTILKSMPTIYVLSYIGILTSIYMAITYIKRSDLLSYIQFSNQISPRKRSFASRLASACLGYFLYNYISISNVTFTLLACIPVGNKNVLYIDGTIECVQPWQGIFIIIAIIHVVPFFIAVIASRSFYDSGAIGIRQFFASYFLPLPMLIYWGILHCKRKKALNVPRIKDAVNESVNMLPKPPLSEEEIIKANILGMIEDPFINHTNAESARYWEGILIFRRMVLSAIAAFSVLPLLRITLQSLTCFSFLLWHIHIHPFGSKASNNFETASLSILTIVAICHIIQGTLLSAGIPAIGPTKIQIFIADWLVWLLTNLFPMLIATALVIFIGVRIAMCCGTAFKRLCITQKDTE